MIIYSNIKKNNMNIIYEIRKYNLIENVTPLHYIILEIDLFFGQFRLFSFTLRK